MKSQIFANNQAIGTEFEQFLSMCKKVLFILIISLQATISLSQEQPQSANHLWASISIPCVVAADELRQQTGIEQLFVLGWAEGEYYSVDTLIPGNGYIINTHAASLDSVCNSQEPQISGFVLPLSNGWNLVGNPYNSNTKLRNLVSEDDLPNIQVITEWTGSQFVSVDVAQNLDAGKAYWVFRDGTSSDGSLLLDSSPSGARIILNGRDTGFLTPHTFESLSPGSYFVLLSHDSYPEQELHVLTVPADETFALTLPLIETPDTEVSRCLTRTDSETGPGYVPELELQFNDGVLTVVYHSHKVFHCGIHGIDTTVQKQPGAISIGMSEAADENGNYSMADCVCDYDITTRVKELEPGDYTVTVNNNLSHSFTIDGANLETCVDGNVAPPGQCPDMFLVIPQINEQQPRNDFCPENQWGSPLAPGDDLSAISSYYSSQGIQIQDPGLCPNPDGFNVNSCAFPAPFYITFVASNNDAGRIFKQALFPESYYYKTYQSQPIQISSSQDDMECPLSIK